MVIVDGNETLRVRQEILNQIANEPSDEEIEEQLIKNNEGVLVCPDVMFKRRCGGFRRGFYMDGWLKSNFDNFVIRAVQKYWDAVILISGIEGSSKSTSAFGFAKYLDTTFPGEYIDETKSTKRHCDRIVFTPQQFMEAIDNSKPETAIVLDEAVLGFLAGDASTDIQKILIKKMVTIRKKRLFIFIVIPSIFLLRMYMAVFRTRAMIHMYTPDGITRGFFKFYSYETKRQLYLNGKKDFNQNCVPPDFSGRVTNTEGFFFDLNEYDAKKEAAIKQITEKPAKEKEEISKKNMQFAIERNRIIACEHQILCLRNSKHTIKDSAVMFSKRYGLKFTPVRIKSIIDEDREQRLKESNMSLEDRKLAERLDKFKDEDLEDIPETIGETEYDNKVQDEQPEL